LTERLSKEELREDPVLKAAARFAQAVRERAATIAIVVGVLVVALVAVHFMRQSRAKTARQAAVVLLDAESYYQNGMLEMAARQFQETAERHGSTPSGKLARLRNADCLLEMGRPEEAARLYEAFLRTRPSDGLLRASALRGTAASLLALGRVEDAGRKFLESAAVDGSPMRSDDLASAGSAFADAGKYDDAIAAYRLLLEKFPESPRAREAREGLAAAAARKGP